MARFIYQWKRTEQGKRLFRVPGSTAPARRRRAAAAAPEPTEPATPTYESLKKDELVALAEERGIDASGTKAEILERLESADG